MIISYENVNEQGSDFELSFPTTIHLKIFCQGKFIDSPGNYASTNCPAEESLDWGEDFESYIDVMTALRDGEVMRVIKRNIMNRDFYVNNGGLQCRQCYEDTEAYHKQIASLTPHIVADTKSKEEENFLMKYFEREIKSNHYVAQAIDDDYISSITGLPLDQFDFIQEMQQIDGSRSIYFSSGSVLLERNMTFGYRVFFAVPNFI